MTQINDPITLPCGQLINNRLAKAALTEGLGDQHNHATEGLATLYRRWALGGTGLLLSGNILVDRRYLERPGNVALSDESGLRALTRMVGAGQSNGTRFWAQLNHAGRQATASTSPEVLAPSAVRGSHMTASQTIHVLSEAEIEQIVDAFARTAQLAMTAGFDGVQVHAAHGYLVSSFLSPNVNQRSDRWGGDLVGRSRLLFAIVRRVRQSIGADKALAIKLNSADFQQGGFGEDDALRLIEQLNDEGIDCLEISGGTYETLGSRLWDGLGQGAAKASTQIREAYFLDFARKATRISKMPLMLTGGFRTPQAMNSALTHDGLSLIGIGRPLIAQPEVSADWLADQPGLSEQRMGELSRFRIGWYYHAIRQLAAGLEPDFDIDQKVATKLTQQADAAQAAGLVT
ncbi:MAG: hypothetical protein AB8C46_08110 [Burkholderiaceae bacterium]